MPPSAAGPSTGQDLPVVADPPIGKVPPTGQVPPIVEEKFDTTPNVNYMQHFNNHCLFCYVVNKLFHFVQQSAFRLS